MERGREPSEARVFLRPIGNPQPLAFLAIAGGSATLAVMQLGWISSSNWQQAGLALVAFVVPLQLLATVFGYLGRDGAAGAGFALSGAGWLIIGLSLLTTAPGSTSEALGVFLLSVSVAMLVPAIGSAASGRPVPGVVAAAIALRFAATAIYELTELGGWESVAGAVGLALCVVALAAASIRIGQAEGGVSEPV